jgi:TRAP-type C4-dicarboxylate transport system permease small subunit
MTGGPEQAAPATRPPTSALKRVLDRVLEAALFVSLSAMTLAVLWQVVSRFVLRDPSSITEELARFLMMWVGLLGATYAVGQGLHPSVGGVHFALSRVLPLGGLTRGMPRLLVGAFAALVLLAGGLELVRLTLELNQTSAALRLPLGWVYAVLPVSGLLLLLYCCCAPASGDR